MSAPNKVVSDSGSDERTPAVNNDLDFNGESKSNYGHWTGHVPPNPLLDVQIDKAVAAVCPMCEHCNVYWLGLTTGHVPSL